MALALHLSQDVDSVVVPGGGGRVTCCPDTGLTVSPQGPAHLVVVHAEVVLLDAPQARQAGGVDYLEDARLLVLPLDVGGVALAGVVEQLLEEVPEEAAVGAGGLALGFGLTGGWLGGGREGSLGGGGGGRHGRVLAHRVLAVTV